MIGRARLLCLLLAFLAGPTLANGETDGEANGQVNADTHIWLNSAAYQRPARAPAAPATVAVPGDTLTAAPAEPEPRVRGANPTMTVPHTSTPPTLDGRLDDAEWENAALARDFWVSLEQRAPTSATVVRVLRDADYLYFAFVCHDDHPGDILADRTRRDAGLANDDHVSVLLDAYLDARTISSYSVNPVGTQNDAIAGGRARKIEWKGDWQAGAQITDFGWTAEIAIPYRILNYHREAREFGINFERYQNRTDEISHWSNVTPQFKNELMGRLSGLEPPARGKLQPWSLMPYVVGGINTSDIEGDSKDTQVHAGAEIRYEPAPNTTAVLSLYPDFSTLETQVTGIDFSYTEKFRSDPRPFFQEGSAYFGDDVSYFYSNRVADFYAGGKGFAQLDANGIGGFVTYAPDDRWDGVLRLQRNFDPTHSAAVMAVTTDRQDLRNQLIVARTGGRQASGIYYDADLAWSNTEEEVFDQGGAGKAALGWRSDAWDFAIAGDRYDEEYYPANGLFKADRYGTRSVSASGRYYERLTGRLREVTGNVIWEDRRTLAGEVQSRGAYVDASVESAGQIRLFALYYDGDYRPSPARGEFANHLNHDRYYLTGLDFNTRSSTHGYGVYFGNGELGGGDYRYLTGYLWVRPTATVLLNVASERIDNFGTSDQTIATASWDVTAQDGFVARYIWAEGPDYVRVAYRRMVRKGMDLFVVYNEDGFGEAEFSVKLLWALL